MAWYNFLKKESTFELIVKQFENTGCTCAGNITVESEIMCSTYTGMLFICHNNIHDNYIRHYIVNEEDVIYRDYPVSPITKYVTNIPIEEGIMSHSIFIRFELPSIIW